jgi:hypothetical protein
VLGEVAVQDAVDELQFVERVAFHGITCRG